MTATIRIMALDSLVEALRAAGLPATASLRDANSVGSWPVVVVSLQGESKNSAGQQTFMECQLRVRIDCLPSQQPDEIAYQIDDLVTKVELVLLAARDMTPTLGIDGVWDLELRGYSTFMRDGDAMVFAGYDAVIKYRHNLRDPRIYTSPGN